MKGFFLVRKLLSMHLNSVILDLQVVTLRSHATNRVSLTFNKNLRESLICKGYFFFWVNSATFVKTKQNK